MRRRLRSGHGAHSMESVRRMRWNMSAIDRNMTVGYPNKPLLCVRRFSHCHGIVIYAHSSDSCEGAMFRLAGFGLLRIACILYPNIFGMRDCCAHHMPSTGILLSKRTHLPSIPSVLNAAS